MIKKYPLAMVFLAIATPAYADTPTQQSDPLVLNLSGNSFGKSDEEEIKIVDLCNTGSCIYTIGTDGTIFKTPTTASDWNPTPSH